MRQASRVGVHWAWVMSGAKGHEEDQMGLGVLEKWAGPVGRPGRASDEFM